MNRQKRKKRCTKKTDEINDNDEDEDDDDDAETAWILPRCFS